MADSMSDVEPKDMNETKNEETLDLKMPKDSEDGLKDTESGNNVISWSSDEDTEYYTSSDEDENGSYDSEDKWLETAKADKIFWYGYAQKLFGMHDDQKVTFALFERKQFIKKVMEALNFGPIFDTFCFSLPRPKLLEDGYKQSVKNVENILLQCKNGLIKSSTVNFPTDSSKQMAEKLILKLNKKLEKAHINPVLCNTGLEVEVETKGDKKPADSDIEVDKNKTLDCKENDETQGRSQKKKGVAEKGYSQKEEVKKKKLGEKTKDHPTQKAYAKVNYEYQFDDSEDSDEYDGASEDEDEFSDMTEEEIIESLLGNSFPHSLIHMLSDGKSNILSSWCGQIQCRVNPVSKTISVLMFSYIPTYSADIHSKLINTKVTRPVTKAISQQIEKFECGRLMRMDIQLTSLKELSVVHQNNEEMILYSKLTPPVKFYQRLVSTSARYRNKWKERQPFLPFDGKCFTECSQEYMFVLGGSLSEMSDIVAQIMKCNPTQRLDLNPDEMVMSELEKKIEEGKGKKDYSLQQKDVDEKSVAQANEKIKLDILEKYGLISKQVDGELKGTDKVNEVQGQVKSYNCIDDLDFHPCYKDFIRRIDSEKLEKHLNGELGAGERTNFDFNFPENDDMDKLTVADYLKAENDEDMYFSFCHSNFESTDNTHHCRICRECMDWRNWHCPVCNKCAYGQYNPKCQHCGFKPDRNKIIIQPLSYYKRFLLGRKPNIVKREWNVDLSDTDIPMWTKQIDVDQDSKKKFDLKEYLNHDNLGIINLWNIALSISSEGPRMYINRYYSQKFRWDISMGLKTFI